MKKEHVKLTQNDRKELETLVRKGKLKARKYRRVLGLLELDRGKTYTMSTLQKGTTLKNNVRKWEGIHLMTLKISAQAQKIIDIQR